MRKKLTMMCLAVVLLSFTGGTADGYDGTTLTSTYERPSPTLSSGQTLEMLEDLVQGLESSADSIMGQLSVLSTQQASSGGQLQRMNDFFIPAADAQNSQQEYLVTTYSQQAKELRHSLDDAIADGAEAADLATSTAIDTTSLLDKLSKDLSKINISQQVDIDNLKQELEELKGDISEQTEGSLDTLRDSLTSAGNEVQGLMDHMNARHCEHGSGTFLEGSTTISFTNAFTLKPKVILTMAGFVAQMGQPTSTHLDSLGFDQYVTDVSTDNFTVNMHSLTGGAPELEKVYINWAACQHEN